MSSQAESAPSANSQPLPEGFRDLVLQFGTFVRVLWASGGRHRLILLTIGTVSVIVLTAVVQIVLNAWNKPFYDAVQAKNLPGFIHQLGIFAIIAAGLLILNVAQAWLREMIKVSSREWLTRDLFDQWLKPGRAMRLSYAGEIGVNPDQRIHEDTRNLSERSADLGIGLFQASLMLVSFIGVLWVLSGDLTLPIGGTTITIPGYMVWCALIYAATGSLLTWVVGRPLVDINATRYQRESELRFALVQANQHAESIAQQRNEEPEKERLKLDLENVLERMRKTVFATARLTWVTAGYGWISLVAPIIIAAPNYFNGQLTFGELMMVVGGFYQVNQSLRWFVDNFAQLADWRATLMRVMTFRETLLTFEDKLAGGEHIEYAEDGGGKLALENVAFKASGEKARFDTDRLDVAPGERVLVVDKTQGRTPLLPAIAGQWPWGSGKLQRPAGDNVMFLTPQPYFPKGSLRAALAYPSDPSAISQSDAAAALERVGLSRLSRQLDHPARWWRKLSNDDQARLSLARLLVHKPKWVLCEGLTDAIATDYRDLVTSIFDRELADSALISISRRSTEGPLCKRVVHLMSGEEAAAPAQVSSGGLPHPAET